MLYGGPLGTYLSGLSSSSSPSSSMSHSQVMNSSSFGTNNSTGSNYSSLGLRRTNSRYRNTASSLSSTSGLTHTTPTTSSNSFSSYYTPPVRRKYGTPESDVPKSSSRYLTRTSTNVTPMNSSVTSSVNTTHSPIIGSSILPQYPRKSPNKIGSTYGTTSTLSATLGTSSSWNSDLNTATNKMIDYKKLYEEERLASEDLCKEIKLARMELSKLESQLDFSTSGRRYSASDSKFECLWEALVEQLNIQRNQMEILRWKDSTPHPPNFELKEYDTLVTCKTSEKENPNLEKELKTIEELRSESEKLHAQHRALIRVVSRLHREQ